MNNVVNNTVTELSATL